MIRESTASRESRRPAGARRVASARGNVSRRRDLTEPQLAPTATSALLYATRHDYIAIKPTLLAVLHFERRASIIFKLHRYIDNIPLKNRTSPYFAEITRSTKLTEFSVIHARLCLISTGTSSLVAILTASQQTTGSSLRPVASVGANSHRAALLLHASINLRVISFFFFSRVPHGSFRSVHKKASCEKIARRLNII